MKAIEVTSNLTYRKIIQIIFVKDAILQELITNKEIRRPEVLTDAIFIQPYTRVKHLTDKKLYAENTARLYLNKLSEMRILEKRVIQGHHYYLNLELIKILSELSINAKTLQPISYNVFLRGPTRTRNIFYYAEIQYSKKSC